MIPDTERGLQTATPGTTPSPAELRGLVTEPPPWVDAGPAADRLAAVFRAAQARRWVPLQHALPGRADGFFYIVLGDVYPGTSLGQRDRAYRADFDVVTEQIESASLDWALSTLGDHRDVLADLETSMTSDLALAPLMQAARDYTQVLQRLPTKYIPIPHLDPGMYPYEEIEVEDPRARLANERTAISRFDSPYLSLLFTHPQRRTIIDELASADDPKTAAPTLRRVFADAHHGIKEFRAKLLGSPHHIWRYPTIVVGGLARQGWDRNEPLVRYALDIAHLKSSDEWDTVFLVAGIALAAAGLGVTGPAGWAILLADVVATGMHAYYLYAREKENELAEAASVFRSGTPFTDRQTDYGTAALTGAAALISAAFLLGGVLPSLSRAGRAPLLPADVPPPRLPSRRAAPPDAAARRARVAQAPGPVRTPRPPHLDRGEVRPPAQPARQRQVVGGQGSEPGGAGDVVSPEARALEPDARGSGRDAVERRGLDVRSAKAGGGKGPTRRTAPSGPSRAKAIGAGAGPPTIPKFNRAQQKRLRELQALLHDLGLDFDDLGLASEADVAAFFRSFDDPMLAIDALELDVAKTILIRSEFADPQMLRTTTPRLSTIAPDSPEGLAIRVKRGPAVPEGHRLPRATDVPDAEYGGYWGGDRGHSPWFSDVDAVNEVTGHKPIPFRNGEPSFKAWARERAILGNMTGIDHVDFAAADRALLKQYPKRWRNQSEVAEWRSTQKLTWHHEPDLETMTLVPTALHSNVPHVGGASAARRIQALLKEARRLADVP